MSLGKKLETTLTELKTAKLRESEARDAAQVEKIRKERTELDAFCAQVSAHIRAKIEGGMVPAFKVSDYGRQGWIRKGQEGKAPHQDIWDGLKAWAAEQELEINPKEEHDGGGVSSWITIKVQPKQTD